MGRITIELVRKRSEHNDGEISTLEELALHQEKIVRIENLDKWCRHLKVLLLQNNSISRLENLSRLKCLEYLNLAMNNIEVIEGLEGCESLRKLDLTLNFVGKVSSVAALMYNSFLEELYLTGNPCSEYKGYRDFVVSNVPQLHALDGVEVSPSERIAARQILPEIQPRVNSSEGEHSIKRDVQKSMILPDIDDENFWNISSPDTPEVRAQIQRKQEQEEEAKKKDVSGIRRDPPKPRKLFDASGFPFNVNEGKYEFSLQDLDREGMLVLELKLPKYMDTSLVNLDIQPTYVRAIIKKKIFQLVLPEEVRLDESTAQRSQTTGYLVITLPKLKQSGVISFRKSENCDVKKLSGTNLKMANFPLRADGDQETTEHKNDCSSTFKGTYLDDELYVDESEVPPLI